MGPNNSLLSFFPVGYTPRKEQVLILNRLEPLLLDTSKKFIVVRAPTGSGKSAICTAISRYLNSLDKSSYLICSRKYLQTQYMDDHSNVYKNFWGKSNYTCPLISASCSGCPADSQPDSRGYAQFLQSNCTTKTIGDKCPYISARNTAATAESSLLNIEAFVANTINKKLWDKRECLMIDEAHCLSDRITSFFEVTVNGAWVHSDIVKTFTRDDAAMRYALGSPVLDLLLSYYKKKAGTLVTARLPVPVGLTKSIGYLELPDVEWVYDKGREVLIPLKGGGLLDKFLFAYANKVILLSATISPNLATELGLNSSNSVYIDVASSFDTSNHKIQFVPRIGALSRKTLPGRIPMIYKWCMDLRLENLGKRGIIHTTSYALTEQLEQRYLLDTPVLPEIIFHTRKKNIDELLDTYKQTPGAVLFTPSLTEGFDGEGDLLEWQVLVKCPFPSLGDPRIKAFIKSKFGTTLFNERTVSTLIQTLGRGIRSSTDTCTSYILDRNASRLINKCCSTEGAHAHSVPHYMKTIWKDREIREQL